MAQEVLEFVHADGWEKKTSVVDHIHKYSKLLFISFTEASLTLFNHIEFSKQLKMDL